MYKLPCYCCNKDFYTLKWVKAKKDFICCSCNKVILIGQPKEICSGKIENKWFKFYYCINCGCTDNEMYNTIMNNIF